MTYVSPIEDIIIKRFSCRNYVESSIQEDIRRQLANFTTSIHSGPFGNPMRFDLVAATEKDRGALRRLGTYGFIRGATGFIIGAMQEGEKNLEDFGYLMERIILYATDLGLGTCWLGGTFTKSSFGQKISARQAELIPCVASVGYVSENPRRLETLFRRGGTPDRRLLWERLFFDNGFGMPLTRENAGAYAGPLEMVRLGPSASNKQPWRIVKCESRWHFYLRRTPGYRENMLVRLFTVADLQRIDMGIAMCHFELAARERGLDGHWEISDPGVEKSEESTEYTASWSAGK